MTELLWKTLVACWMHCSIFCTPVGALHRIVTFVYWILSICVLVYTAVTSCELVLIVTWYNYSIRL